ncbi:MAG: hypothetical protein LH474_00385 [Chamaesiphon sp.]|nr:hypothetical protein [Chamaesiphon sp.]
MSPDQLKQYHYLLLIALSIGVQICLWLDPAIAVPNAGTVIENQATGSYQNDNTEAQTTQSIESDKVTLTVAEVAGINVTSITVSEAATTVTNGGSYQGDGTINAGDIVYYDYLITNVGNDPTQFFIPDSPANVSSGGTFDQTNNPIQIIAYKLTGTNVVLPTPVSVPAGGKRTGPDTATGTTGGLLAKNGIIPAGGSVTIRVPIKINSTATIGQSVSVTIGNTSPNDNTAATQNQVYLNNNNQDIYTQDNSDGTTNTANVVVETIGTPANGTREASATAQATVILPLVQGFKSVKLTVDADNSATISIGDTLTWTLSYINNSSTNITNFQIADLLPSNVAITSNGAQTITINTAQGSTIPAKNSSYTGAGSLGATTNNLLSSPITLLPGGVITVSIPVKIKAGTPAAIILSNQSIATGTELIAAGVKTDNVDRTTTNLPTDVIVPVDSVLQAQNNSIDPTTATVLATSPTVILVKRITGINNQPVNPNDGRVLDAFVDDPGDTNDTRPKWPTPVNSYPVGQTNGGLVKPADTVEYTIYFLSTGTATAHNVLFCDRIPNNVTFIDKAFNSIPVGSGGLPGADRGIAIYRNGSLNAYTNVADGDIARYFLPQQEPTYGDYAQYFPTTDPTKKVCNGPNDNGAVVVYLGNIPKADSPGLPNTSYGFVRFRGLVK